MKLTKTLKSSKYFLAYVFIGLATGSYFPILSTYLKNDLHFSGHQVGTITAVMTIFSIAALPVWGLIADYFRSSKKTLLVSLVLSSLLMGSLVLTQNYWIFFLLIIFFMIFRAPIFSLYDEILIDFCKRENISYGSVRSGGSLGYASALLIGSIFTQYYGNVVLFMLSAIFYFIVATLIIFSEDVKQTAKEEKLNIKVDVPILFKTKGFMITLIVYAICFGLLDCNMTYMSTYLYQFSQSEKYISIAVFLSAIIELPVLYSTKYVYRKFSLKQIYIFLNGLNILRYGILFIAPSTITVLIMAPLHGITFGLGYPIMVEYIKGKVDGKVIATAYSVFAALLALTTALFNYASGVLLDYIESNMHYLFILFVALYTFNLLLSIFKLKQDQ